MTCSETIDMIEQWALAQLQGPLDKLEPIVDALSKSFTDARPETYEPYLNTPEAALAYALFFAPQTVVRVDEALRGILNRLPPFTTERPLRILDLGCGIGSGLLAARSIFGDTCEYTGVDWSSDALQTLRALMPNAKTVLSKLDAYVPESSYDVIISSFAWNEAFPSRETKARAIQRYLDALALDTPSFLLLLEPASRQETPAFLNLRKLPEFASYPIYAPCPHQSVCPLISGKMGICHDVRPFKPTPSMKRLNRRLYRSISDVKYALLAWGHKDGPLAEGFGHADFFRMIGPMDKGKGVLTCRVCMGDGQLRQLELPAAALSAERRHELLRRSRGDCGWLEGALSVRKTFGTTQRSADVRWTDEAPAEVIDVVEDDSFHFTF